VQIGSLSLKTNTLNKKLLFYRYSMDKIKTILKQVEEVQFAIDTNVTNEQMYTKLYTLLDEVWDILHDGIYNSE
jgi:hypothetical protein